MENFNYHRPASVDAAVSAAKAHPEAKYMSGGMTLIPAMKQGLAAPSDIIDLGALKNAGVSLGATLVIKAGTTHAEVANIGDPHVRHKGTIGGSIANNDPAADYPAACLGLGATIHTNARKIAADDFFTGMFSTALEEGEVVTAIEFPLPKKAGYAKFPNPASRYAMIGVFVADTAGGARAAVTGGGHGVFRAAEIEGALAKGFSSASLNGVKVASDNVAGDLHASADYRAHLVTVMAKRAVDAAK